MKKALATLAIFALAATAAHAQILAWDFSGEGGTSQSTNTTSTADTFNAGLDASNLLARGAGAAYSGANNSFRTTGFGSDGISLANTDYFTFNISAAAGNTLSLTNIVANFAGTASYSAGTGVTMAFAYSFDDTNYTLLPTFNRVGNGANTVDLSTVGALQNLSDTTTVFFRMYASGQTTTGGWGYASAATQGTNGLAINGTIAAVPEPSTIALLGLGLVAGVAGLRRKLS